MRPDGAAAAGQVLHRLVESARLKPSFPAAAGRASSLAVHRATAVAADDLAHTVSPSSDDRPDAATARNARSCDRCPGTAFGRCRPWITRSSVVLPVRLSPTMP